MSRRLTSLAPHLILWGILAFLAVFLGWPLLHVFRGAFADKDGFSLAYVTALLTDPLQLQALANSLTIAILVTLSCLVVSLPMAWFMARRCFPGKGLCSALLLIPLILPPFVGAVGMKILFARAGSLSALLMRVGLTDGPIDWLGRFPMLGIVLLETMHLFPVLYLNLVASFANIDPSLEDAAANLGATPWRTFRRVTLPLAMPGIFAGTTLVFIWAFTELGTPLVFGLRRVLPVMIYDSVSEVGTNPMGYARVVLVLVISALGFWISKRLTRRSQRTATLGRLSVQRQETPLRGLPLVALYAFMGTVLFVALLPHVSVIMIALSRRWFLSVLPEGWTLEFFGRALGSDLTQGAMVNSLLLAMSASVIDVILGFCIAWLCVRRKLVGSDWLDTVAMLPIAVPGLVIAFGYLGCFAAHFPGSWLDPRTNPMALLAISYAVRRLPYMVRAAHAGLQQTSVTYEEAAANLGASPLRVIRRITLPLLTANLLAGAVLCFAFSMLEVSDSLILAQSEPFYPITKAIYSLMDGLENGVNVAAALGTWAMCLLGAGMLWAACLLGKRMGTMFRAG
ncbi:MAG: iron ABC transporter permease [Verrucomicrobia bacterium]|jgi:iron(III) transport system permease protein|nr:iron ABC transporter permease [Verrucomicrobiota bacterium]MBT7065746.1 iron ABC transporter permease [Verrucomicrobiota bacterium]MBT7699042.1 iron ABC transporter permease [Verrucomicrobiota bacterium]